MQRLQPVTQGVCHSDYGNESLSHACMRASETRALPRKTLPVTVAALRARATASIRALGAGFSRPHDGARRGAVDAVMGRGLRQRDVPICEAHVAPGDPHDAAAGKMTRKTLRPQRTPDIGANEDGARLQP